MYSNPIPSLRELIDAAPTRFPGRTLIKYVRDGAVVEKTHSQVRSDSLAFCRMLRKQCPARTHIAILAKSSYEYIIALTGVLISGHVAVPLPPDADAETLSAILNDADVTAVLHDAAVAPTLKTIAARCPAVRFTLALDDAASFAEILETYSDASPFASLSDVTVNGDDCALIIYTSGTTGEQKGVMLSGKALVQNQMYEPRSARLRRADVMLSVLPLYHIFCFVSDYIGPLLRGNTLCLNGDMRELFRNLLVFRPHQMRVVPMLAKSILARIRAVQAQQPQLSPREAAAKVTGGNLDMMLSGGAYLDPALCSAFEEYGVFLRQGYGMSEVCGKVTVPDEDVSPASVGRLMNFCRARICDGEIQLQTPCRMLGYYKRPAQTAAVFTEDGWVKTGDLGRLTEDGQLFITGRLKNLIILSGGENVSPEGIENRYKAFPLVAEVCVYAENDAIIAEVFPDEAYAQQHGVTDLAAALEKITDELNLNAPPTHAVARVIVRTAPFEKTATGKIKRKTGAQP